MSSRKRSRERKKRSEPQYVAMFIYGTLRTGGTLNSWLDGELRGKPMFAALHGHSLFANKSGTYPYLMRGGSDQPVFGEVVFMRRGARFDSLVDMEMNAGYEVDVVTAKVGGNDMRALAFVFPDRGSRGWLGEKIMHGDWIKYATRREKNRRVRELARMYAAVEAEQLETIPANRK